MVALISQTHLGSESLSVSIKTFLSKALALRLREMMVSIIHPDQTYCVPSRLIMDNVTLVCNVLVVSSELGFDAGLL